MKNLPDTPQKHRGRFICGLLDEFFKELFRAISVADSIPKRNTGAESEASRAGNDTRLADAVDGLLARIDATCSSRDARGGVIQRHHEIE